MLLTKEEKVFINSKKSFLFEISEKELESFCDIPSADIEFSLYIFGDNIELSNIKRKKVLESLLNLFNEFNTLTDLINNSNNLTEDKKNKYKVKLISWIILADHFRKELEKELNMENNNKQNIIVILYNINELYNLVKINSLKLDSQQNKKLQ